MANAQPINVEKFATVVERGWLQHQMTHEVTFGCARLAWWRWWRWWWWIIFLFVCVFVRLNGKSIALSLVFVTFRFLLLLAFSHFCFSHSIHILWQYTAPSVGLLSQAFHIFNYWHFICPSSSRRRCRCHCMLEMCNLRVRREMKMNCECQFECVSALSTFDFPSSDF